MTVSHASRAVMTDHVVRVSGASFRQIDHWRTQGYLRPVGLGGTGHAFYWAAAEVRVAVLMKRLVDAGLTPAAACRAARNGGVLAPGIRVAVDDDPGDGR